MFISTYQNRGFSLMEVIIAIGLFAILASGVFNVVTGSYRSFYGTGDKQVITEYAQEGLEAVRSIRDNFWQDIENVSGAGNKGLVKTSGYWRFSGTSDSLGELTRTVAITDVQRSSGTYQIVTSGGNNDPNTKKVVITVSGSGISNYVLTAYLTNWSYKTWTQTDWSGSGAREFWSNSTMASSSFSSTTTSTIGQISIRSTAGQYNPTSYIYSSIYTIESSDKELRSVAVEQNVPAGCTLSITLEASNNVAMSSASSQVFSDVSTSFYVSSTPASLNGNKFLRYKLNMTPCSSNTVTPTLYSVSFNYR